MGKVEIKKFIVLFIKKHLTFYMILSYTLSHMATINLKLKDDIHELFHEVAKQRGSTMQGVLSAFVESYVNNPSHFVIKMEVESGSSFISNSGNNSFVDCKINGKKGK